MFCRDRLHVVGAYCAARDRLALVGWRCETADGPGAPAATPMSRADCDRVDRTPFSIFQGYIYPVMGGEPRAPPTQCYGTIVTP
jgi:hypothetical protein